jgi:rod shape determining protein RodA
MRRDIDWIFWGSLILLVAFGVAAVASAASPLPHYGRVLSRQFEALGVGFLVFGLAWRWPYPVYQGQAKAIYAASLALLVLVLIVGTSHKGHRSWIEFFHITLQPSELARVGFIIALADYLSRREKTVSRPEVVGGAILLALPVLLLILREPDVSSALTFVPIILAMLFCAGAKPAHLVGFLLWGAVAGSLVLADLFYEARYSGGDYAPRAMLFFLEAFHRVGPFLAFLAMPFAAAALWRRLAEFLGARLPLAKALRWAAIVAVGFLCAVASVRLLKDYQRRRFLAYLAPHSRASGAAYHAQQSKIAVGSGGVIGKGLFSGTQSRLGFLPERHTDFIYAVIGEETGFVGSMSLLALYLLLIRRILAAAKTAPDRFGSLVCSGIAAMMGFEFLVNAGMCVGLNPVAGLPLPLVSYGGSSLLATFWALGIVANVYSRRLRMEF